MSWDECAPLAAQFCEQAGIPAEAEALVAFYRRQLTGTAAAVDGGYPANTDLVLGDGKPTLKRRKGADRRARPRWRWSRRCTSAVCSTSSPAPPI
ncbi:hypothetical protein P3H15_36825 [Rhodococcus sp. T2V]|uniref:hypothetical protein n=1 Tax=Rhodococcus sp. T2V TaxID=3034164 RepID=UPI0023E1E517|nr:hypothetical protein [Rhodococcus sp. T2V]MDF3310583.1 hypothetical protein [Rhodococcus sp. T2V]